MKEVNLKLAAKTCMKSPAFIFQIKNKLKILSAVMLVAAVTLVSCGGADSGGDVESTNYTVTYDANGADSGTVPVDPVNYKENQVVTVPGNAGNLVKGYFYYSGWNTQADGNGTTYTQGETFKIGTDDAILYARWTANPTYTVTYDGNGNMDGRVPVDTTHYEQGQDVTVAGNAGTLIKDHFNFSGWNTQADGSGTTYTQGETFKIGRDDVILYARWIANPAYTVTYDGNGNTDGAVPVDSANYEQGVTVTVSENTGNFVNIDGATTAYRFAGWNTQADGNGTDRNPPSTFVMGTDNVTLYAKWVAYALRDTGPAGGLIFYDKGSYSGTPSWRYMEAAPSDQSSGAPWGCYGTAINGADGEDIGTGYQNTIDIEAGCTTPGTAADICANLTFGGYDDWFLPSSFEVYEMYLKLRAYGFGGFTYQYWTSEEYSAYYAWFAYFNDGSQAHYSKGQPHAVRAAREF